MRLPAAATRTTSESRKLKSKMPSLGSKSFQSWRMLTPSTARLVRTELLQGEPAAEREKTPCGISPNATFVRQSEAARRETTWGDLRKGKRRNWWVDVLKIRQNQPLLCQSNSLQKMQSRDHVQSSWRRRRSGGRSWS